MAPLPPPATAVQGAPVKAVEKVSKKQLRQQQKKAAVVATHKKSGVLDYAFDKGEKVMLSINTSKASGGYKVGVRLKLRGKSTLCEWRRGKNCVVSNTLEGAAIAYARAGP